MNIYIEKKNQKLVKYEEEYFFPEEKEEILSEVSRSIFAKITSATSEPENIIVEDCEQVKDSTTKIEMQDSPKEKEENSSLPVFFKKSKVDLSKRIDVISKTLIRTVKRFYSSKFWTTERTLYDVDDEEVFKTLENIDTVSIEFSQMFFFPLWPFL